MPGPRTPPAPRLPPGTRQATIDLGLTLLVAAISVAVSFVGGAHLAAVGPLTVALGLLASLPLAARRRWPWPVLVATVAAALALVGTHRQAGAGVLGPLLALGSLAAHRPRRQSLPALALTAVATVAALAVAAGPFTRTDAGLGAVMLLAAWALGNNLTTRRAYAAELTARTHGQDRRRAVDAQAAVDRERSRIARELHDVVAHHVSVMVVQAGAARRTLDRDPGRAKEAMSAIETTGRGALTEMRRLLGVLRGGRDAPDTLAPQPTIAEIGALVEQMRVAGLPVEMAVLGTPRPLSAGVDLSAYRIVQEALTNALKHAGPTRARVQLCYGEHELEVIVDDDGSDPECPPEPGRALPTTGGGRGLLGMRERVAVFGGQLRVGPRGGGGYSVHARLPLEPVPA